MHDYSCQYSRTGFSEIVRTSFCACSKQVIGCDTVSNLMHIENNPVWDV